MNNNQTCMLIYQNSELEVLYTPGNSDFLLITFAPANFKANSADYWGKTLAFKKNISTLGFVAKRSNWYPVAAMEEAILAIDVVLNKYLEKVTYGTSMGGYAALKFSATLRATHAIALAPQYSIDPSIVSAFDNRYHSNFKSNLNKEMDIKATDTIKNSYVFFDPMYREDKINFELINKSCPHIKPFRVRFTHHFPIELFSSADTATQLFKLIREENENELMQLTCLRRRTSQVRIRYIAELLARRNPDHALNLLFKHGNKLNNSQHAHGYVGIGKSFKSSGDIKKAIECYLKASELMPENTGFLQELTSLYVKSSDSQTAKECALKAINIDNKNAYLYNSLAGVQLSLGELDSAEISLNTAIKLHKHSDFYSRLSKIHSRKRNHAEAIVYAKNAVELAPNIPYHVEVLLKALFDNLQISDAVTIARNALLKWPDNEKFLNALNNVEY